MRWTDSLDRMTGWAAGWVGLSEIGERVKGKVKEPTATSRKPDESTGPQVRRGEARRGSGVRGGRLYSCGCDVV